MSKPSQNTVGYKKPPRDRQFKKGQSGNPKGRPKGSRNLDSVIREELERFLTIKEDGRPIKVPAIVVIARQVVRQAAAGDLKAVDRTHALARAAGLFPSAEEDNAPAYDPDQAARDQALVEDFLARQAAITIADQGEDGEPEVTE